MIFLPISKAAARPHRSYCDCIARGLGMRYGPASRDRSAVRSSHLACAMATPCSPGRDKLAARSQLMRRDHAASLARSETQNPGPHEVPCERFELARYQRTTESVEPRHGPAMRSSVESQLPSRLRSGIRTLHAKNPPTGYRGGLRVGPIAGPERGHSLELGLGPRSESHGRQQSVVKLGLLGRDLGIDHSYAIQQKCARVAIFGCKKLSSEDILGCCDGAHGEHPFDRHSGILSDLEKISPYIRERAQNAVSDHSGPNLRSRSRAADKPTPRSGALAPRSFKMRSQSNLASHARPSGPTDPRESRLAHRASASSLSRARTRTRPDEHVRPYASRRTHACSSYTRDLRSWRAHLCPD